MNEHDLLCPYHGTDFLHGSPVGCACSLIQAVRANERANERERLYRRWQEDGHGVMFNKQRDDLTPAQRVGKWLRGQS